MIVFVESNFMLEVALGQEQSESAVKIIELAERGSIDLAFPAFSLSEPFATVSQRGRQSRKLINEFNLHLREVGRSKPHRLDVEQLRPMPDVLADFAARESDSLWSTLGRILRVGNALATDLDVFEAARGYQDNYKFSAQDSIIYSSVVKHLRLHQATGLHYFVNKNWKEFRDTAVVNELVELRCRLVDGFDEAVALLDRRLA